MRVLTSAMQQNSINAILMIKSHSFVSVSVMQPRTKE